MNLLLDSALKGTAILLAAWIASLLLRRASASVRHAVWLGALFAVAAMPVALSIPLSAIPAAIRILVPAIANGPHLAARKLPWLLIIWLAGASLVLGRLMAGIWTARRITKSAQYLNGVLYSERATTPMTWGFSRPVVILPAYAIQWTPAQRDLVLRHEQAHVVRHDWLWHMVSSVLTAVLWFHPLMWLASSQLRREAEGAADDLVLASGAAPADYADRLVDVARRLPGFSTPVAVLPMIRMPELETRVRSILDPARRRASAGIFARLAIVLAAVALVLPLVLTGQRVPQGNSKGATQPRVIHKIDPEYTQEAQEARIEGTVLLGVKITTDGTPTRIHVMRSLGHGLDQKAMEAVEHWQFKPGTKNGKPVEVPASIEITFQLK